MDLIGGRSAVAVVGIELIGTELERQGVAVHRLDWTPPSESATPGLAAVARAAGRVASANDEAIRRIADARPLLVDVAPAIDVVPGMDARTFLHAGPPLAWADMPGPMRGAVIGAAVFEGLADTADEAVRILDDGGVNLEPNHDHASVAPMAGIVSPSMPVWVVENDSAGNRAHSPVNEGMGRVLRFGAYHPEHLAHLAWMRAKLLPVLREALHRLARPIDLRSVIGQALQMGDECHNRHKAASALFFRDLGEALVGGSASQADLASTIGFLTRNEIFFLNPTMAAAKAALDAAAGIDNCTIVTAMTRNGREFGLRTSGTGDRWFTGPASVIAGLYFPGFGPDDANRDLGDSAITETWGLGGFAVAASPAVLMSVGGSIDDSLNVTRSMYDITAGESAVFQIPSLGFRGTALGIDVREVVHTGITPVINTGIAHRHPGVGQIGAGVSRPPMSAFEAALGALAEGASVH
jgi:hypothetical protein